MRIAQISTMASPVRRHGSHSIEHLVWLLTEQLVKLGHDVTVFAAAGSQTSGRLVETMPGPYATEGSLSNWQTCETINLARAIAQSGEFDVLHSHAYLWGLPFAPLSKAPIVHTLHVQPYDDEMQLWSQCPDATVTAISRFQWQAYPALRPAGVVYHGVEPDEFTFRKDPRDYLCFLGRVVAGKGARAAAHVARALGVRLVIAGPRNEYFERYVEPLVDGKRVEYVGAVAGRERDQLLGGARALLYPVQRPEPFGLVQVEAMMCGTPVAALRIGAVSEVVDEGVTGATASSVNRLADAVRVALQLDRAAVRRRAVERFSADRMARDYLKIYEATAGKGRERPLPDHSKPSRRRRQRAGVRA